MCILYKKIDGMFKKLIPEAYEKRVSRQNQKSHLKIPETAMLNDNELIEILEQQLHKDAGDFSVQGFGNYTVIERGDCMHGGYTRCFHKRGVGVDVGPGDFLAMDVHQWHSNTSIFETEEDDIKNNSKLEKVFNDNPEVGTVGLDKNYTRLTFVCYLRKKY